MRVKEVYNPNEVIPMKLALERTEELRELFIGSVLSLRNFGNYAQVIYREKVIASIKLNYKSKTTMVTYLLEMISLFKEVSK